MDHDLTINSNFPSVSHLAKLTAVCLVLMLSGCSDEEPKRFLEEGKILLQKGELESARVQFKNAIQLEPKLADAYFRIALIDEQKQDWTGLIVNLLETLVNDPKHLEGQLKLGQIYLSSGQYDKAEEQVKLVLELNPGNPTALLLESAILFRKGNNFEALQGVERVLAKQPNLADAIGLQANILIADKRSDEAIQALKDGVEHNPDDIDLRLLKIRMEIELNNISEAVHDYEVLIDQHPDDVDFRSSLANLLSQNGQSEAAEASLNQAISQYPKEVALKLKLIDLIERRDVEQAESMLKNYIDEAPDDLSLKIRLTDFYIARQQFGDADGILQAILSNTKSETDSLTAKVKLAQIALLQKDMAKVERLATEILNVDANHSDALLLRAGLRFNKNDPDGAIADLRIVLRDRPRSEQAMILLALASSTKGEMEVSESQWRKVLEINPNSRVAILTLANEMLKRDEIDRAEELSNKTAKANPEDPVPIELLIQLKAAKKDWPGALTAVEKLKRIPKANVAVKYWQGVIAALQGKTQEAIQYYQEVLTVQPDQSQALSNLSQLYETTGHRSDLVAYLKTLSAKNAGSSAALNNSVASAYIAEKNWEEAEKYLRESSQSNPTDVDLKLKLVDVIELQSESRAEINLKELVRKQPDQVKFKFRLAGFYAEHNRYPEASALLQEVIKSDPAGKNGITAQLKLSELAWINNDALKAKVLLDQVVSKDSKNKEALMMRASIHLSERNLDATINDLNQVLENRADFEPALLMLAQAYQFQNATDKAEAAWGKVLIAQPDNLAALKPTVTNLLKRENWPQAKELIDNALKYSPSNPRILELEIQMAFAKKDWLAAKQSIAALKKLPQSQLTANMLLASLALSQEQSEEAIQIYQDILNKNPDVPDALVALAQVYQKTQKQRELIEYLKSLLQKNPNAGSAYQILAMAYATDKNWDDAAKVLQEKLARNPKDTQSYALLALLYANQGNDAAVEKTYQSGLAALGDSLQLLTDQAKYYVLKKDFSKSIETYEEILKKYPENEEAANNLADLLINHRADDKTSVDRALNIVQRFKNATNAAVQDTYGWVLLKSGDFKQALPVLKQSSASMPNDASVRYHLAVAYQQNGDLSAAVNELEKSLSLAREHGEFFDIETAKNLLKQWLSK